jgi:Arm DNA-binding domain
MPRPTKDGVPAKPARRRALTERYVLNVRGEAKVFGVWDARERGLALTVQVSGFKSFRFVYSYRGKPRWFNMGNISLAQARRWAAELRFEVAQGKDPLSERKAKRGALSFAAVYERFLEEHAKKKNRSWPQADYLVRGHLLPRWAELDAASIARADVKAAMAAISAPSVANQVLAAASAVFSWAIREEVSGLTANPAAGIDRHRTRSRERVLGDNEVPQFWSAFEDESLAVCSALKTVLLTGQRPGEVRHMRMEHIKEGSWWEMPGMPDPKLGWPGTRTHSLTGYSSRQRRCRSYPRRATLTPASRSPTLAAGRLVISTLPCARYPRKFAPTIRSRHTISDVLSAPR